MKTFPNADNLPDDSIRDVLSPSCRSLTTFERVTWLSKEGHQQNCQVHIQPTFTILPLKSDG